jgi:hypothetical protein
MPKNGKSYKWHGTALVLYGAYFGRPIYKIRIFLYIFYALLDTLLMIVFSSSDSILIKSYKKICRPSLPSALRVLLCGRSFPTILTKAIFHNI